MSLKVIKAGLQDSIQDAGRFGYQWLGVNPAGVMDSFSARVANIIVGNEPDEPVLEMHFPAAAFLFEEDALLSIGGADFSPSVNGEMIPLWHPVMVNKNSVLQFDQLQSGARCYLAIQNGFKADRWLSSYSTHLKAGAGGFHGRALQKGDVISYCKQFDFSSYLGERDLNVLHWNADTDWEHAGADATIAIIPGNEWDWINSTSHDQLLSGSFQVHPLSDRMGYRLQGEVLESANKTELISSAVGFGTIQLLPDGQLIVLMADHQTTGGYPRLAHVVSAHLSKLAQRRAGDELRFRLVHMGKAEELWSLQQHHLLLLQNACKFRLEEYFK